MNVFAVCSSLFAAHSHKGSKMSWTWSVRGNRQQEAAGKAKEGALLKKRVGLGRKMDIHDKKQSAHTHNRCDTEGLFSATKEYGVRGCKQSIS